MSQAVRPRLRPFASVVELGKLNIFELWLGIPIAWTLLSPAVAFETRTLALMVLALILKAATSSAALALDDIAGLRDGVDLKNHGDTDRYAVSKPLVDGRLSMRQAVDFARLAIFIALAALVAALVVAWPIPAWVVAFEIAVIFLALNYSYWLKLSYWGGGELITLVAVGSTLLIPYALVARSVSPAAWIQSGLIGLWMLQIAVFSNTQDREGDRQALRWTVAALSSDRVNRAFIVTVFLSSAVLLASGVRSGALHSWILFALVPAFALQAGQIWLGVFQRRWLAARLLGFKAFRLATGALLIVNLLAE